MNDDIISYDPFLCIYESYDGRTVKVTFKCPHCGSHSCVRAKYSNSNHFFEGNFRCKVCRKGSFKGESFNYYSICFVKERFEIVEQLNLFD